MTAPAISLGTDAAGLDRRTRWLVWFTNRILQQDLTAEDRIAILSTMLGREISGFPKERWGELGDLAGKMSAAACRGAAQARADVTLALLTPAGHG